MLAAVVIDFLLTDELLNPDWPSNIIELRAAESTIRERGCYTGNRRCRLNDFI